MTNNIEWFLGVLAVGIAIGLLISKDVDCFGVEIKPNNSVKAFVGFKPALP